MTARRWRSQTIYDGVVRSTTRAFLYALGEDDEDIARPHTGVVHTGGEMSPCNLLLREQALHARTGISQGGGTPHECPMVSVSNGLSVAHSGPLPRDLVTRRSLESAARQAAAPALARPPLGGDLEKYAAVVGSAHLGAITHSGGVMWERDP